jgi:hypothetical protein
MKVWLPIILWLPLIALLIWPSPSDAHIFYCGKYKEVTDSLKERYHERKTHMGYSQQQGRATVIIEVWESNGEGTSTFTILVVQPNGLACMIEAGQEFEYLGKEKGDAI